MALTSESICGNGTVTLKSALLVRKPPLDSDIQGLANLDWVIIPLKLCIFGMGVQVILSKTD